MESIIKNRHLWRIRHQLVNRPYAGKMSFIMNWCEVNETLYALFYLGSYQTTLLKKVATLYYSVAYSPYLIKTFDSSELWIKKTFKDQLHTFPVGREVGHNLFFLTIIQLYLDKSFVKTNAFNATLCQHSLIDHVVQLVFNRTATAIQYQNMHFFFNF